MSEELYDLIYSDPPWKQTKGGLRKVRPNQNKELDYNTMPIENIFELHQKIPVNDNHIVFMWTIDKFLPETELYMKNLGYKLHARIIWDKTNGIAPAFTIRYSHEYLLWFYKGKFISIETTQRGKYTTIIREKATKHSKKPIAAYEMIESMYPNLKKLEMFARSNRYGWDAFGNEVENSIDLSD